ncbi:MAG: PDZ domain-containing protein, partial [Patescibacteria group bacterium]|nr:PDZ domain-containing protein [Patescibacteria group bacterium]
PEFAPSEGLRVGQWAVALGRAFESDAPNMAVGIVSARSRVWGKAAQTDAAVSPNNYGGPLIDLAGRVLGVLAPLSPQGDDDEAGYEWYDSGIGFAVHADQILRALPRLKAGEDLVPGLLGLSFRGANTAVGDTVVAACHPNSPAQKAGIKVGDRVVAVAGRPVERAAQLKEELARFYAGETVRLTLVRADQRMESELELAAKLLPYEHPFLGILPMRDVRPDGGVAVRFVYPESPAAKAGIEPGDLLAALAGEPTNGPNALRESLARHNPEEPVSLTVVHGDQSRDVQITLGRLPDVIPEGPLPTAHEKKEPAGEAVPPQIRVSVKVPEFPNEAWAYVPGGRPPKTPYGLVVWLHEPGGAAWDELLLQWKAECDRDGWILLVPEAADPKQWNRTELPLVRKLMDQVMADYPIDPARVVLAGRGPGGAMALLAASHNRDVVRGVAVLDSPLPPAIAPNEPLERLAFYVARAVKSPHASAVEKGIEQLRKAKYPVTLKDLGDDPRPLEPAERTELSRWLDCLDRL